MNEDYTNYLEKRLERENRKIALSRSRRERFIARVVRLYNKQGLKVYEVPYQLTTFKRADIARDFNDPCAHYFIAVDSSGIEKEQRCLYWDPDYEFTEVNYLILALQNLAEANAHTL